ncbi:hypothetical protein HDEF_0011 [Candidatus Hamiltonella defensa 5AT (Acyrthosiphon pisum)]|uniref:Uncharacterized protein n=1 Tax=Hamiltonella defensa subsp. Acyrthosiphon pisum (strain 5AT) TaxID=572265 RepID=C4K830_HAMD5|nr:hypothetical protein HDEF_0011 [Candidatus Hamiltonella defensa 5AT (Acyrthosiphon pisum)]
MPKNLRHTNMFEINLIKNQIQNFSDRAEALRGYL